MTARLNVRFLASVEVDKSLKLMALLIGERRGIYQLEGALGDQAWLLARARAKFIMPKEGIAAQAGG